VDAEDAGDAGDAGDVAEPGAGGADAALGRTWALLAVLFVIGFLGAAGFTTTRGAADEFDVDHVESDATIDAADAAGAAAEIDPATTPEAAKVRFDLWVGAIGVVGGTAVVVAFVTASWLWALVGLAGARPSWRVVVSWGVPPAIVLGGVLAGLFLGRQPGDSVDQQLAREMRPLIGAIAACTLPGLAALVGVRELSSRGERHGSPRAQVAYVLHLRTVVRRVVGALGGLLTLVVVATGMRRRALLALEPGHDIPAETVVLYGFVFAALLGLFYSVAVAALDARSGALVDRVQELPDPTDPALHAALERRRDLTTLVGAGTASWQSFQGGVVVAAPLLTALLGIATGD
jgi:hypothetical protein